MASNQKPMKRNLPQYGSHVTINLGIRGSKCFSESIAVFDLMDVVWPGRLGVRGVE